MSDGYDGDEVELEVARYAVRTFLVGNTHIVSIAAAARGIWKNGTCEAECLITRDPFLVELDQFQEYRDNWQPHEAPILKCSCGIYGCLTLGGLLQQFPSAATRMIAVIAAEGKTIIGPVGLRTAAARVVAYWMSDTLARYTTVLRSLPEAKVYHSPSIMCEDYGIPYDNVDMAKLRLLQRHRPPRR